LLQYPLILLITLGILTYTGVRVGRGVITSLNFFDRIKHEFRRVGVRPSEQQEQALRNDFAAIAAENARHKLRERLHQQIVLNQEQVQFTHIAQLSRAQVALVKDIGATLQALEAEYLKREKSLNSAQAREALRLVVEQAVVQITTLTTASTPALPTFDVHSNGDAQYHSEAQQAE
jgi:molybdopterin converting factor small subunit